MHSLIDSIVPDALSLSDGLLLRRRQPFSGWLAMTRNIRHALLCSEAFSSLPVTVSLPLCFRCARVCFSPAPLPLTSADCTLFLCLCLPVAYIFDWKWTICYFKLRLSLCTLLPYSSTASSTWPVFFFLFSLFTLLLQGPSDSALPIIRINVKQRLSADCS